MKGKGFRTFEVSSEDEARQELGKVVDDYTWLSREEKDAAVAAAKFTESQTRFGPIFSVEWEAK